MSDFLFSSIRVPKGELSSDLDSIYLGEPIGCTEYHGHWGSLAVTRSRYNGFQPLETSSHICAVVGGPVLHFQDNRFLTGRDRTAGTRAILERWSSDRMDWKEDVSGPFAALFIQKSDGTVTVVTDLMLSLPVYRYADGGRVVIGTHVDATARASEQTGRLDEVAILDFILHFAVTYPFTFFQGIRQCLPATVHRVARAPDSEQVELEVEAPYWEPAEGRSYKRLRDAAEALREAVAGEVERVTESMEQVAQFLSGGEDSRALAGMLPKRLRRDAITLLDSMDREGRISGKAAAAYGATFKPQFREPLHYLSILPEASALVGSGHQYIHSHTVGLSGRARLDEYRGVFGGYGADSLFKGLYARKPAICHRHAFIPEVPRAGETRSQAVAHALFPAALLEEVTRRRREHLALVKNLRPRTAHEWFVLWPMTMRLTVPNLYTNRRLFASYEPYLSNRAVQIGAGVPTSWKLNRRLFHRAFRRYLSGTRALPSVDGRFPFLPWWLNVPTQFGTMAARRLERLFVRRGERRDPWYDWPSIVSSREWQTAVDRAMETASRLPGMEAVAEEDALRGNALNIYQKANVLQACFHVRQHQRGQTAVTRTESQARPVSPGDPRNPARGESGSWE